MSENLNQKNEPSQNETHTATSIKSKQGWIRRGIYMLIALLILGGGLFYSFRERDYHKFNEIWNRIQTHDARAVDAWNRIGDAIQDGKINDVQAANLLEKDFRSEYLEIDRELKGLDMSKLSEKYLIDFQLLRHITDSWLDISDKLVRSLRSGDEGLVQAGEAAKNKLLRELATEEKSDVK